MVLTALMHYDKLPDLFVICKEYLGIYTSMKVKNNYSYMVQTGSSKGEEHMHIAASQLFSCIKTNYHMHPFIRTSSTLLVKVKKYYT